MSFLSDLLGSAYKEGMTEEEISEALKTAKVGVTPETAPELNKLKEALSRANGEAAEYKKKLRERQTDAEAAEQERKAEQERLVEENKQLKRSIALAERKSKLIGLGYAEDLADKTAIAMVDGDLDTVIANQSAFLESMKQTILKGQMQATPRPGAGAGTQGVDYATKIAEASANADYAAVAYYTRLQAEADASGE
jgi:light-regulated signal transduction histidine kinase (bacteriophytochrome)